MWNGRLKIAVRSPAQDGRANEELIEVLAGALGLARRELCLVSGEKNRLKEFSLPLSVEEARRRIHEQLSSD